MDLLLQALNGGYRKPAVACSLLAQHIDYIARLSLRFDRSKKLTMSLDAEELPEITQVEEDRLLSEFLRIRSALEPKREGGEK